MGAGIAAYQFKHRRLYRLQQGLRDAGRKGNAQRITIASRVFNGNQPLLPGNLDFEQAAGTEQPLQMAGQLRVGETTQQLVAGEIADAEQQIVDAVGGANSLGFQQPLELLFHFGDGIGVQQLTQVGIAQEIT